MRIAYEEKREDNESVSVVVSVKTNDSSESVSAIPYGFGRDRAECMNGHSTLQWRSTIGGHNPGHRN